MKKPAKIKLLVTDDHTLFRKGLVALLEDFEEFGKILEAADGEEALKLIKKHRPHVVLLDLKMPKLSGVQLMPILYREHPEVKVLVLTMHSDASVINALIREGAHGYLLKDSDIEEVVEAIRTVVYTDNNYANKLVANALLNQASPRKPIDPDVQSGPELNKHEEMLLQLIVEQNTSAEIARKMNLGKRTVEEYRRALLQKTGVKNTAGLVAFALEHNLVLKKL